MTCCVYRNICLTYRELPGDSWKWRRRHFEESKHGQVVFEKFQMKSRQNGCKQLPDKLLYLLCSLVVFSVQSDSSQLFSTLMANTNVLTNNFPFRMMYLKWRKSKRFENLPTVTSKLILRSWQIQSLVIKSLVPNVLDILRSLGLGTALRHQRHTKSELVNKILMRYYKLLIPSCHSNTKFHNPAKRDMHMNSTDNAHSCIDAQIKLVH